VAQSLGLGLKVWKRHLQDTFPWCFFYPSLPFEHRWGFKQSHSSPEYRKASQLAFNKLNEAEVTL
jgi:hypothetical protein